MSLGFSQKGGYGNQRSASSTPQRGQPPPLSLRVEAIEIALGRLSQTVQELGDLSECDNEESGDAEGRGLASRVSEMETHIEALKATLSNHINEIEEANGLSTMHIRARVARATKMYENKTGDHKKDVKASNVTTTLRADTKLRLIFPQEELSDGRVCMGAISVDHETMAISTGWVIVADSKKKIHFVDDFEI